MSIFRNLAKAVHPDVCKNPNATQMMQEVLANRNNKDVLLALARKWGLRLDGTFDETTFKTHSSQNVFEAVVGAIVKYAFRYKGKMYNVRGVIVRIRPITKGKIAGGREYTIYNFLDGRIWNHKSLTEPQFEIVGMASEDELRIGQEKRESVILDKKMNDKYRMERARNAFCTLGLLPNKDYRGMNKMVYIKNKGLKELVKTTAKSVYYKDFLYIDARYTSVHNVIFVEDKSM